MTELEQVKRELLLGEYTCILKNGDTRYASTARGVKPLVECLQSKQDFQGGVAADKVVGKATAFLYVLLKIKAVYASVISKAALRVFQTHAIQIEYGELAEYIVNRQKNGPCPFETCVAQTENAREAYIQILQKMQELHITV